MKGIVSVIIVATTLQSCILYVKSYNFTCPSQANWQFQAIEKCNSTLEYFCLYNNVESIYVEGCDGPDWDRKGSKRIFAGFFTRGHCIPERFQPFKFWTNASMSDCIYTKSICSERGQIVNDEDSTKEDRTCRCDYRKNYSFIQTPRNPCFCKPSEEDCSCYIKSCPVNFTLSADYECTNNRLHGSSKCTDIIKYYETFDEQTEVITKPYRSSDIRWRTLIVICLCLMHITVTSGFFFAVIFPKWSSKRLELLKTIISRRLKNNDKYKFRNDRTEKGPSKNDLGEVIDDVDVQNVVRFDVKKNESSESTSDAGRLEITSDPLETGVNQLMTFNDRDFQVAEVSVAVEIHRQTEHGDGDQVDQVALIDLQQKAFSERTSKEEEIYFLRIIHLLFRVACPVVRMFFDNEFKPNMLRKTLDQNKLELERKYRKNNSVINNTQWSLLFPSGKDIKNADKVDVGTTETETEGTIDQTNNKSSETTAVVKEHSNGYFKVTKGKEILEVNQTSTLGKTEISEDFDIRLMIYLLQSLAQYKIGRLYPVSCDTSITAMLSRIKFIRNETTQIFEGRICKDVFNKYWEAIGQAVLNLSSRYIRNIDNHKNQEEMKLLLGRLIDLNPIKIDDNTLSQYILMSEIFPAMMLQKIVSEYCSSSNQSIEVVLINEKHDLYHKRIKTKLCCKCLEFASYIKIIPEKTWDELYENNDGRNIHSCPSKLKNCSECFVPKHINTSDLSVTMPLVLYTKNILKHIIKILGEKNVYDFLMKKQHILYHSMDEKKCCKCGKIPSEKKLISRKEWYTLFGENSKKRPCIAGISDCCCQYSVKNRIDISEITDMEENFLIRLFYVAGPISFINKVNQEAFSHFLNWTGDREPLREALKELLMMIKDEDFRNYMSQLIRSCKMSLLDEPIRKKIDTKGWISRNLRQQQTITGHQLKILILDEDGWDVKTVHIPQDLSLSIGTTTFRDLTPEEHNFLVVMYGLTKIVYPVIRNECNTHCPKFDKIRMDIYKESNDDPSEDTQNGHQKKNNLSSNLKKHFFSPTWDWKTLDLKLMILLLKKTKTDEQKEDYVCQLNVIDNIRREMVQSSSGLLNKTDFLVNMELIRKAVLHLGGQRYERELQNLENFQNILD